MRIKTWCPWVNASAMQTWRSPFLSTSVISRGDDIFRPPTGTRWPISSPGPNACGHFKRPNSTWKAGETTSRRKSATNPCRSHILGGSSTSEAQARNRRQVFIVTHNPNLAVVCDADQMIYASIDKEDGNKVTYSSGALENPAMTRHATNVLEGTREAFDMRGGKYLIADLP